MPMMKQSPIIFLFNSPIDSGCDYVMQTMRIVARRNPVYGLCLGDVISLPNYLMEKDKWIVRKTHGATIIRPVSMFPGLRFRFVRQVTYILAALALRLFIDIKHQPARRFLWYFEPFHIPTLLNLFGNYQTIYDCVDYYPGFHDVARKEHAKLMHQSTYVFANSKVLARALHKFRSDVVLVPQGFASDVFHGVRVSPVVPNKRTYTVGYIGSISARMDFSLLKKVTRKLPDVSFVFVGGKESNVFGIHDDAQQAFRSLCQNSNVTWVPEVAKARIPMYLARFDVGFVPYRADSTFNRYAFPMKVLEYFALGRPVISTNILSLHDYVRGGLVTQADAADAVVRAIRYYRSHGWNSHNQKLQVAEAKRNAWENKVDTIMTTLSWVS